MNSVASYFPEVASNWMKNERSMFVVPVNKASARGDERNAGRSSRDAGMGFDTASRASASRAPSIAQMFGSDFAAHLGRIGYAR
jgi:hypothetical protein